MDFQFTSLMAFSTSLSVHAVAAVVSPRSWSLAVSKSLVFLWFTSFPVVTCSQLFSTSAASTTSIAQSATTAFQDEADLLLGELALRALFDLELLEPNECRHPPEESFLWPRKCRDWVPLPHLRHEQLQEIDLVHMPIILTDTCSRLDLKWCLFFCEGDAACLGLPLWCNLSRSPWPEAVRSTPRRLFMSFNIIRVNVLKVAALITIGLRVALRRMLVAPVQTTMPLQQALHPRDFLALVCVNPQIFQPGHSKSFIIINMHFYYKSYCRKVPSRIWNVEHFYLDCGKNI